MSTVQILIVAVVGPLVLSLLNGGQSKAKEKRGEKRQIAFEERLNARQDALAKHTELKLDAIHTLANGAYTAAIERDLSATEGTLAALHELAALRLRAGETPATDALAYVQATEARIEHLRTELKARAALVEKADQQRDEANGSPLA